MSKTKQAKLLGVSRGSLYYKSKLEVKDEELCSLIEVVMVKHPAYGYHRVALELGINKKRAQRVMQKHNLKPARRACILPYKKDDIGKEALWYPDITKALCPLVPNVIWVSDFTYIRFKGIFIYLCTVIDLFTREVLGFNLMTSHTTELIKRAFIKAIKKASTTPTWFHSDQGSEYTSDKFLSLLASNNVKPLIAWASSRDVTKNKSMIIRSWASGFQEGEVLAKKLKEKKIKSVATLVSTDDYSIAVINGFKESINAKIFDLGEVAVNENDYKTQIIKAKNAKVEAIAFCLSPLQISSFGLQLRRFKFFPVLLSCVTVSGKSEIEASKGSLLGAYFATIPVEPKFVNRYLKTFSHGSFLGGAAVHYELYKLIHELRSKGIDKDMMISELLKVRNRKTTLGKIGIFKEAGDQWIKLPHVINQIN